MPLNVMPLSSLKSESIPPHPLRQALVSNFIVYLHQNHHPVVLHHLHYIMLYQLVKTIISNCDGLRISLPTPYFRKHHPVDVISTSTSSKNIFSGRSFVNQQ